LYIHSNELAGIGILTSSTAIFFGNRKEKSTPTHREYTTPISNRMQPALHTFAVLSQKSLPQHCTIARFSVFLLCGGEFFFKRILNENFF
jgi:hypothetical protein